MRKVFSDARHWQILALSVLLVYSIAGFDFGASTIPSLVGLAVALGTQALCQRLRGEAFDPRSPFITGLSLGLLLRTDSLWITALAAALAIGSKFVFRIRGKHLWNPATFGIVAVLLGTHHVWISPGQWGAALWTGTLIAFLAILVLSRAGRLDTALAFIGAWGGLLFARAAWLGDPATIPIHQLETGSLLLFACFMITDPRTTPDHPAARIGFAVAVAILAHWLMFFQQMRPALYLSLAALAPMVPLLDSLFPARRFAWRAAPEDAGRTGLLPKPVRIAGAALGIAGLLAATIQPALAFCGFYVAQADAKLFNKASKVVLVHDGDYTAITMASDYQGDPKEFALVIPVPVVVQKDDIHVVSPDLIDRLDAYTAPRLTEYFDRDPCAPPVVYKAIPTPMTAPAELNAVAGAAVRGVTIEARYEVGVYDILILSAKESDGLVTWLKENQYRIPAGAEDVLGSYIRQSMHFFVAKVNLERQAKAESHYLEPIEVAYSSPKFMLPIRLGTVNASGPQDLIVFAITRQGRVETANYRPAKLATQVDVPLFVRDDFGEVYKTAFEHAVENDGMRSIFLEYAWDIGMGCDPCSGEVPTPSELATLGARWIGGPGIQPQPTPPTMPQPRFVPPIQAGVSTSFITRLHIRYDRAHFPEDLMLTETHDRNFFQVVYSLHHPFSGAASCEAGAAYRKGLHERFEQEATNLSDLTGWPVADIRQRMDKAGETSAAQPR